MNFSENGQKTLDCVPCDLLLGKATPIFIEYNFHLLQFFTNYYNFYFFFISSIYILFFIRKDHKVVHIVVRLKGGVSLYDA